MRKVVFRDGKFEFFLNQYALNNAGWGEGAAGDIPLGLRNLKPIPGHDQTQPRSLLPVPTEQAIREEREPGN